MGRHGLEDWSGSRGHHFFLGCASGFPPLLDPTPELEEVGADRVSGPGLAGWYALGWSWLPGGWASPPDVGAGAGLPLWAWARPKQLKLRTSITSNNTQGSDFDWVVRKTAVPGPDIRQWDIVHLKLDDWVSLLPIAPTQIGFFTPSRTEQSFTANNVHHFIAFDRIWRGCHTLDDA
jgi:hypothetical protein